MAKATDSLPTTSELGPADQGQSIALTLFAHAKFEPGWRYELARGILVTTEIPGLYHGRIVWRLAQLFDRCHQ